MTLLLFVSGIELGRGLKNLLDRDIRKLWNIGFGSVNTATII